MPLIRSVLRQLTANRADVQSLAAERLDAFVREQKDLLRRNAFPPPSSPVRQALPPPRWEPDEIEGVHIPRRFAEQGAEDDRTVAQQRRFQRAKEILRPEFSAAARKRRAPSPDSSLLEHAAISSDHGAMAVDDGPESVEEPEKVDRRRTVGFQKRARYKMLKPGATEPERVSAAVPATKKTDPKRKEKEKDKTGKKRKSVSNALIDGFSPDNIAKRRITLKPKNTAVRRDSTPPVRPGLPDLSFTEMNFLRNRKPRPAFELDVHDPGECRGRLRECMDEVITREEQRRRRDWRRRDQTGQEKSVSYRPATEPERSVSRSFAPQGHFSDQRPLSARERSLSRSFRRGGGESEEDDGRSELSRLGYQRRFIGEEQQVSLQGDLPRASTPAAQAPENVEIAQEREEEGLQQETVDITRLPSRERSIQESPQPEKKEQPQEPTKDPGLARPPPAQRSSSPLNAILRLCETGDQPARSVEPTHPVTVAQVNISKSAAPIPTPQPERAPPRPTTIDDDDPVAQINELLSWPSNPAQPNPPPSHAHHADNPSPQQNMAPPRTDDCSYMQYTRTPEQDPEHYPEYPAPDPEPSQHPYHDDPYPQEYTSLYNQDASYYEEPEPGAYYPRTSTRSETLYDARSERPQLRIERALSIARDGWGGYGSGVRAGTGGLGSGEDLMVEAGLEVEMGGFWRPFRL